MEHKLRVEAEILRESERRGVIRTKLAELLAHLDDDDERKGAMHNAMGRNCVKSAHSIHRHESFSHELGSE